MTEYSFAFLTFSGAIELNIGLIFHYMLLAIFVQNILILREDLAVTPGF